MSDFCFQKKVTNIKKGLDFMNSQYFPDHENIFTSTVPLSHVNRADPATQEWSGDGNNTPC